MSRFIEFDGQRIDVDRQLYEIEKAEAEEDLVEFIRQAWHTIEPGAPYVHSWHVDMIAEHLAAITDGVELEDGTPYNRLLINVPPGTMKSLICNVFWPSWEWGPRNMPHLRYVCAAHKIENLSARDSRRMRQLITSDWYQERWGDRVKLAKDQNEKLNFVNSASGFRIATAITSLTGIRGDRVIIDDPHSVDSAASEAMREGEVTTFLEAIPTRLTSPIHSAIVVIMQRLHEQDISGVILDKRLGYDHVMLPMRYDPVRAAPTMLGIEDPRQEEGELLFPARFPLDVVDRDEKAMGPYATAGQNQQEPTPRGGGVIKGAWWETWMEEAFPPFDYIVASLDTAYTTKQENDFSALTVWGVFSGDYSTMRAENFVNARGKMRSNAEEAARFDDGVRIRDMLDHSPESVPRVMLMGAWQEKLELSALVAKVASTCRKMRVDKLLVEGKASGLSVAQELRRLYGSEDWAVQLINPGALDKLARVYSIQHLFSEGMIYAPDRHWADLVIRQCEVFPKGKNDDLVDTVSQALRHMRETGLLVRAPERMAEIDAGRRHTGAKPAPLYPT
jgi:predicted phage terminase large subunit-like protein